MSTQKESSFFYVENEVIRHFILSLVCSIVCSVTLAFVEGNHYILIFILYGLYTFPSILIMGGLFSFIIETQIASRFSPKNRFLRYLFKVILYLLSGFLFITLQIWIYRRPFIFSSIYYL